MELNKIYYDDCIVGMSKIPDNTIDFVLCDLPYGITNNTWDSIVPLDKMWEQINRLIKDTSAIALFCAEPFASKLRLSSSLYKYDWVWDKCMGTGFLNAKKQPLRTHEYISIFYKKQPTYNPQFFYKEHKRKMGGMHLKPHSRNYGSQKNHICEAHDNMCYPLSIISIPQVRGNSKEKLDHPTQKPVALMKYLINTYTNEGATVLDFCVGSGTTAVAAIETNRNFIGFDNDLNSYQIACSRTRRALIEPRLAL